MRINFQQLDMLVLDPHVKKLLTNFKVIGEFSILVNTIR
jgi:hypothetical protein